MFLKAKAVCMHTYPYYFTWLPWYFTFPVRFQLNSAFPIHCWMGNLRTRLLENEHKGKKITNSFLWSCHLSASIGIEKYFTFSDSIFVVSLISSANELIIQSATLNNKLQYLNHLLVTFKENFLLHCLSPLSTSPSPSTPLYFPFPLHPLEFVRAIIWCVVYTHQGCGNYRSKVINYNYNYLKILLLNYNFNYQLHL